MHGRLPAAAAACRQERRRQVGLGAPAPLPPLRAASNSRVPLEMVAVCAAAQPRKPSRPAIPPLRLG